jgi:hypothetical protein
VVAGQENSAAGKARIRQARIVLGKTVHNTSTVPPGVAVCWFCR